MSGSQSTEKRAELVARLRQGIEEVKDSDRFKDYLRFTAAFHSYSFHNCMLIWCQRPDATQVAGFRSWLKLGRYVRRGEKGISILAPMPWKKTDEENEEVLSGINFKVVHVFDVIQTEGADLPTLTTTLAGDAEELVARLYTVAEDEGLTFTATTKESMPSATTCGVPRSFGLVPRSRHLHSLRKRWPMN